MNNSSTTALTPSASYVVLLGIWQKSIDNLLSLSTTYATPPLACRPHHPNTILQQPLPSSGPPIDRLPQSAPSIVSPSEPLDHPDNPAPCKPTLQNFTNNLPHPQSGPDPQHDRMPQLVPPKAPPPAPNPPASPIQHPATQPSQINRCPSTISGTRSLTQNNAPKIEPCAVPQPPPIQQTPIPNWAKPAVLPPAENALTGKFCMGKNHWPSPRPEKKTIPFRKPPQTKPHTANRKDFLRPP